MANINGTLAANFVAVPSVSSPVHQLGGSMRVASGIVECVAGDFSAGDTIMLAPVPSNASVISITLAHDDIDTGTTITTDVGLYTSDGNVTAVDDDCYASAITALRGAVAMPGTEVAFEARNLDKHGQKVFQDAGLSADPNLQYFIGLKHDAAGDAAGTIAFTITYIVD